jgi:acyl-CoA synthetase (AMP-forming)/AMP-acid ligase II
LYSRPVFHCFGLVLAIMASLTPRNRHGACGIFQPHPVMEAIQNEKCTAVHGVPSMFIAMLNTLISKITVFAFAHRHHGRLALPD